MNDTLATRTAACAACGRDSAVIQPGDLCAGCLEYRQPSAQPHRIMSFEKPSRAMLDALRWFDAGNVCTVVREPGACTWSWLWHFESLRSGQNGGYPLDSTGWHGGTGRALERRGWISGETDSKSQLKGLDQVMRYSITPAGHEFLRRITAECNHTLRYRMTSALVRCGDCLVPIPSNENDETGKVLARPVEVT